VPKKVMIDKENTTIVNGAGKKADIEARVSRIKEAQIERRPPTTIAKSCKSGWRSSPAALP
jgi:hypothetical protein